MARRHLINRRPILVTGVPRSGTTWLARWLASGDGMALTGREPMNPRGRQYALGGTLDGWTRLTAPTARQSRSLRSAYRGWNPRVYSRYGARRWAAPLPWTRLVVKDPFALLSIPAVVRHTGAVPVLVFRHPGAVLVSYRRMGWQPDLEELTAVLSQTHEDGHRDIAGLPPNLDGGTAAAMGHFWARLHDIALADVERTHTSTVVVAHHELAAAHPEAGRRFAEGLDVGWNSAMEAELAQETGSDNSLSSAALHNFDRPPASVAHAWRKHLKEDELQVIEDITADTQRRLNELRFRLDG
jgi:hypothetical protein